MVALRRLLFCGMDVLGGEYPILAFTRRFGSISCVHYPVF
jgi:hypothetical protein